MTEELFVAHSEVVDCDLAGDRALLHMQTNMYFTLNPVAADLWAALDRPRSLDELVRVIVGQYEVSEDCCRADLEALLGEMVTARVVIKTSERLAI